MPKPTALAMPCCSASPSRMSVVTAVPCWRVATSVPAFSALAASTVLLTVSVTMSRSPELTSERPTSSQPSSVGCSQASADSSMTAASAPVASSTSTSSIVTLSSMSGAAATIDSPIGCDWVVTARS